MPIRVTKQFKDDFDFVMAEYVAQGTWTPEEVEGLKKLMREYELADGPDRLRDKLIHFVNGEPKPSAIDDPKERYEFWAAYFADEAKIIRSAPVSGINSRIRQSLASDRRMAA